MASAGAFTAALAMVEHAPLMTGDSEFTMLHRTLRIEWLGEDAR
jgi:hypothetical protein